MRTISNIAELFDCSDWQLFERAFIDVFGEASEYEIEAAYSAYLSTGDIPAWVAEFLNEYPEEYWEEELSPLPDIMA
jgi:hypothetical protein